MDNARTYCVIVNVMETGEMEFKQNLLEEDYDNTHNSAK